MIDGHPWETAELDELRSEQRRFLRDLDDGWVQSHAGRPEGVQTNDDRSSLETDLRRTAQEAINEISGLLRDRMRANRQRRVQAFINANWRGVHGLPTIQRLAAQVSSELVPWDEAQERQVKGAIWLLTMAEHLATDDYKDPRLA